jgi:hypothetical protein
MVRGWRRAIAWVVLAGSILLGSAHPVGAEPRASTWFQDRVGEVEDARGDIRAWYLQHGRNLVEFDLVTARAAPYRTTPAWVGTNTAIVWWIDTVLGRTGPEYQVTFRVQRIAPYSPYIVAVVRDLRANTIRRGCAGTTMDEPTWGVNVTDRHYELTTPRACLGNPSRIRGTVQMIWDTPPRGGQQQVDRWPRSGWSSWVAAA